MHRLVLLLALLAAVPPAPAAAQLMPGDPCWAAEAVLDAGNVRATLLNDGSFFNRQGYRRGYYEVPAGSGDNFSYLSALWIGGLVEDSLHITSSMWGPQLFRAGPLGVDGQPTADCAAANRLYEVRRHDAAPPPQLPTTAARTWPAHLGAPVVDGDGVAGNYAPAAGDRPAVYGEQTVWWIMNDVAAPRVDTAGSATWRFDAPPLRVEVRVAAFAFDVPGNLANASFYRFQITYRGEAPLDSAYVGFYADLNIGDFDDDYVGSDTLLDLGYVYNADGEDADIAAVPPALGYTILRGPRGDDGTPLGMTAAVVLEKGDRWPSEPREFYNSLRGRRTRGLPIVTGGSGRAEDPGADPSAPTTFHFSGDPATGEGWSMMNIDGRGRRYPLFDRYLLVSTGPFALQPGDTEEVWLAIVWSRGADYLDSVRKLKADVAHVRAVSERLFTPVNARMAPPPLPSAPPLAFEGPFPNPAAAQATVRYSLPRAMPVRLVLHDVLGREVARLAGGVHAAGEHAVEVDLRGLAPGTYFVRLALYGTAFTRPLVVAR